MIVDLILAPGRWVADRAWLYLARKVLPTIDDNLADVDA